MTIQTQPPIANCPFCGTEAGVVPHKGYRYKCRVCGRPRIPAQAPLAAPDGAAIESLKRAHQNRVAKVGWQVASAGLAGVAIVSALIAGATSWLFDVGGGGNVALTVLAVLPLVLSFFAFRAGSRAGNRSQTALDEAWQRAVAQWHRQQGGALTPRRLAELTGMDEEQATVWLSEAEVDNLLTTEDADARYRVAAVEGSTSGDATLDEELEQAAQQQLRR